MNINILDRLIRNIPLATPLPPVVPKKQYGYCCDTKMIVLNDSKLLCTECSRTTKNLGDYSKKPESQKVQYNSSGAVLPGSNILKTDDEKIQAISKEYMQKIQSHHQLCEIKIIRTASELMFQFSRGNTKKSQNRDQLFGACLYYSSIRHKNILMDDDIVKMLGLSVKGISKGIGIITRYAAKHRIPFEFDPPIYKLIIKYYLRAIRDNNTNLNTKENRKFCCKLVEEINELGIGYDKGITIKCSSAVYFLMHAIGIGHKFKKKDVSEAMGLSQHFYTTIFVLLKNKKYNSLLSEQYRITN